MITIVDLDMGNVKSVLNMVRHLRHDATISRDPQELGRATALILPGVGAFDEGMTRIDESGLRESLDQAVLERSIPVLGICLGMQLMTLSSEEGQLPGLGWIKARTLKFQVSNFDRPLPIPHMGWNTISGAKPSPVLSGLDENRFYFVHSYHVQCDQPEDVLATTHYGQEFHSAFQQENIHGVQFHPEKSHQFGKRLLNNFCEAIHA